MPEWLLPIIAQVPLVVLFMWYQERAETRQSAAREKQHGEWREFMREQGAANNETVKGIATEVKANTNILTTLNATLIAHDIRSSEAIADVRRIRERLAQAGIGNLEDSPLPQGKK